MVNIFVNARSTQQVMTPYYLASGGGGAPHWVLGPLWICNAGPPLLACDSRQEPSDRRSLLPVDPCKEACKTNTSQTTTAGGVYSLCT